ncbi:NAD(P)H-binding protein [Lonepinella koalarum]|uniref:NAD(P)H-binding protein n=1 Tax=Lonepinella koalarum TaxID=53417 RepID=UPI00226BC386|nr:NAD(P)H-binding protein [Lonepinella koalarum]
MLVTCANGKVGKQIVQNLKNKGLKIRAMDVNEKVHDLVKLYDVDEAVVGDINNPKDVAAALQGIESVLYIPTSGLHNETHSAKVVIDQAVVAKVKKFVMMSAMHPNMSTLLQHTAKLKAEEYLVYKGLTDNLNYTILQPQHYCHNFDIDLVEKLGAYHCFYNKNTKLAVVDVDDVADAAYCVLTQDIHQNATYELSGSSYLSSQEKTDIYNKLTGKNIPCIEVGIEDFIKQIHVTDTYTQDALRAVSYTYGTFGIAGNPNVLQWITGKKATIFEEYLQKQLAKKASLEQA